MKLQNLHEVKYVGAKNLDSVMSYVNDDATIESGFIMRIKRHYDNTIQPVFAVSVQHDEDDGSPFVVVTFFDRQDDSDIFEPDDFVKAVEIHSTKRVL